jgi:hypothetical protein
MSAVARTPHITGSCNWGTITVVTSSTRSVQAARAPSNISCPGLVKIRSPQHSDENGPSSTICAHVRSIAASSQFHHRQSHPDVHGAIVARHQRQPEQDRSDGESHFTGSLCARTGPPLGGGWSRLPRTLPRIVRIATSTQVLSKPT